jgi:hypothetical protein
MLALSIMWGLFSSEQEFVKTSSRQIEAIKGRPKDYVDGSEEGRELQEMKA